MSQAVRTAPARSLAPPATAARGKVETKLLAEIALAAACRGLGDRARPIFEALEHQAPDHPIAAVGRAMAELSAGRADTAAEILRLDALRKRRGHAQVQGLLLLALVAGNRQAEARALAEEIMAGPDGASRRLAMQLRPALQQRAAPPQGAGSLRHRGDRRIG
jgi:thioredoxin-like negative regulator of GroEL